MCKEKNSCTCIDQHDTPLQPKTGCDMYTSYAYLHYPSSTRCKPDSKICSFDQLSNVLAFDQAQWDPWGLDFDYLNPELQETVTQRGLPVATVDSSQGKGRGRYETVWNGMKRYETVKHRETLWNIPRSHRSFRPWCDVSSRCGRLVTIAPFDFLQVRWQFRCSPDRYYREGLSLQAEIPEHGDDRDMLIQVVK